MNLEYGHVYINDINNGKFEESLIKNIHKEKEIYSGFSKNRVVLIDDKDYILTEQERHFYKEKVISSYKEIGMPPDKVYFEKDYNKLAFELFESLDSKYKKSRFFKKQNKNVDFICVEDTEIAVREIREDVLTNYCVMLSTAWSHYKEEQYSNNHIVLPHIYKKTEDNVIKILNALGLQTTNTYFYY